MKTHFHSPKTHFGVDFMDKLATVAATTTTTTANHNNKVCFHVHVDESCAEHTQQNTHTNTRTHKWSNDFYRPTLSQCQQGVKNELRRDGGGPRGRL